MSDITAFRTPRAARRANVLTLIGNSGVEPVIVNDLETPPGRATWVEFMATMGIQQSAEPEPFDD